MWKVFFLSCVLVTYALLAHFGYLVISIVLVLTGFACILTGSIAEFRYRTINGVVCLLLAAVSFFPQNKNSYLLLAASAVLVCIVPGFILRVNFTAIFKAEKNLELVDV
jgi:hypothetical protein